jgi:hypothetical protein
MRGLGFAAVLVVISPSHALTQDYDNATNAAWCAGALGAYVLPSEPAETSINHARSRHLALAQRFFGASRENAAAMVVFETLGSVGAADCNQACAAKKGEARAACFDASPDCKRIVACLAEYTHSGAAAGDPQTTISALPTNAWHQPVPPRGPRLNAGDSEGE